MAYPNYYNGYQPNYYNAPMPDQLAQFRQGQYQPLQQPNQQQSIVWVSGEQEAMSYLVAPNNAVALWDSVQPVIYLKQADASGKPTIKIYDLVERMGNSSKISNQEEYVTRGEFNDLAAKFEAFIAKMNPDTGGEINNG